MLLLYKIHKNTTFRLRQVDKNSCLHGRKKGITEGDGMTSIVTGVCWLETASSGSVSQDGYKTYCEEYLPCRTGLS